MGAHDTEHARHPAPVDAEEVPVEHRRRAARVVIRHAHGQADRDELLSMLGLTVPPVLD